MAQIRSAKKRIRQSAKRRLRNMTVKSRLKTAMGSARQAIASGESEQATASVKQATRLLDKAASKGIIHKRQASRRKSRLAKGENTAKSAQETKEEG